MAGYLTAESDPVFGASDAAGITALDIVDWDTAFGWGDHALAGYLTVESDPVFGASDAAGITALDIVDWDTAFGWGDHALAGYLTAESDPVFGASDAAGITALDIVDWDTAFGWGDHALAGYLTVESDPVFGASDAAGITALDIVDWDTAFGWGDHALAGYLTVESDPVFGASDAAGITALDIVDWDTAFGWGDHALAGYVYDTGDTLTGAYDLTGATLLGASPLTFEGLSADGFESTFTITDPTADNTIAFQNASGTVAFLTDVPAFPDYQSLPTHAGIDEALDVTSNGDGTVNVSDNSASFYDDAMTQISRLDITGNVALGLTDEVANYIVADRDTQTFVALTDLSLIDYVRYLPYAEVYRSGTNVHIQLSPIKGYGLIESSFERWAKTERYARESGLDAISVNVSREITISGGTIWSVNTPYAIPASTVGSREFFVYHSGGVWTRTTNLNPKINNTQYDDGTDLVTLTDDYYTINYIYRGVEGQDHVYVVLGNDEFISVDAAQASNFLAEIPEIVSSHAVLVGRVIVQKNATSGYTIESAFTETFNGASSVNDHGSLTGLTGDDHTQYALLAGRDGSQTLIGGITNTADLILRTTSANAISGADMIFQTGNNGTTEALRILYDGKVGIGTVSPNNALEVLSATSPQLRVAFDGSNYFTQDVSAIGAITFDATGASAGFTFSDPVTFLTGLATTGAIDLTGAEISGVSPLIFEGLSADGFETTLSITDPTADNTITFQDASGTVAFLSDIGGASGWTDDGTVVRLDTSTDNVTVGSALDLAKLSIDGDTDEIQLLVQGSATQTNDLFIIEDSSGVDLFQITANGNIEILQAAQSGADPVALEVTAGAHTSLPASTEVNDVRFNLARTVQFDTGNLAMERAVLIDAPTYAFTGASTITTAATLAVEGAPREGANATFDSNVGLLVGNDEIGNSYSENIVGHGLFINPGISDGTGNVEVRTGLAIVAPSTNVHMGDQTATLDLYAGLYVNGGGLVSTANTRTITNASSIYVDDAPGNGGNVAFTNGPYSLFIDNGDVRLDDDAIIGGSTSSTETLGNVAFSLGGDDLFVAGSAGVEGSIYTDSGLVVGAATTYADGTITSTGALSLNTGGTLTLGDSGDNVAIDSSVWDITSAGVASGLTGLTTTGAVDFTGATLSGASPLIFEGLTANDFESTFTITDPTADNTITFQDASGTVAYLSDITANQNLFETISTTSGTSPVAETTTDTLTLSAGSSNITVTGNSGTDTVTFDIADSYLFNTGDTATGAFDFTGAVLSGASPLIFEGLTANDFESTFTITDPTADNTITFQNASGTVAFTSDILANQNLFETIATTSGTSPVADTTTDTLTLSAGSSNITVTGNSGTDTVTFDIADSYLFNTGDTATGVFDFTGATLSGASPLIFEGLTANDFESTLTITDPTADNTITFQDASGTVAFLSDITANQNLFETISTTSGTSPVADTTTDTLTFSAGSSNITVTGNSGTDTVTFDIADSYLFNTGDTATGAFDFTGATLSGASPLIFEGLTANDFESTFAFTDPTADNTITFQNASGTVAYLTDITANQNLFETISTTSGTSPIADTTTDTLTLSAGSSNITVTGNSGTDTVTFDIADSYLFNTGDTATGAFDFTGAVLSGASPLVFEGLTANDFESTFTITDPTADNTITFQDASGTVAFTSDIPAGSTLWETGAFSTYEDDDDVVVGSSGDETLSDIGFVLNGNDLFVADSAGIEGTIYSDSGLVVGTTTYASGAITATGALALNTGTLDLSAQTTDVTLNNAVDALNFDSNTLSIDALNGRVGIGTAAPNMPLHIATTGVLSGFIMDRTDGKAQMMAVGTTGSSFIFDNTGTFSIYNNTPASIRAGTGNTGGAFNLTSNTSGTRFNSGGLAAYDTVMEGDTDASLLFVDAGLDRVGVGYAANTHRVKFGVKGAPATLSGLSTTAELIDTSATALGVGGALVFGGYKTGTTISEFGAIKGIKENITDNDDAGALLFYTKVNGGSLTEKLRIDSVGTVSIGGDLSVTGGASLSVGAINTSEILDDTIDEDDLDVTGADTAADEECLTFESAGGTGDFEWQACGGTMAFTSSAGVITKTTSTDQLRLTMAEAGDYGLLIDASVAPTVDLAQITNSGQGITATSGVDALSLTYVQATNGAAITGSGLDISLTPSADATDVIRGITLNNVSAGSSTETGLYIGTGYDRDIEFADGTPTIRLADASVLSLTDGTNNLLQLKDLNTNFGAALNAGAFIDRNSYFGEEFNRVRATVAATTAQAWGDVTGLTVTESATSGCDFSIIADQVNGVSRSAALSSDSCNIWTSDSGSTAATHTPFDADNLPVILMKVKPSAASATEDFWVGLGDTAATTTLPPANGIFFTNNDGTNWTGITRLASTSTAVDCGTAVSTTTFALLMIEVRSTTDVHFFFDANVTDGVSFTECGAGSATNIPTGALALMLANSGTNTLDIDFVRVWQDDENEELRIRNLELGNEPDRTTEVKEQGMNYEEKQKKAKQDTMDSLTRSAAIVVEYSSKDFETIMPGTVVSLAGEEIAETVVSIGAYDPQLLGVTTPQPGVMVGEGLGDGVRVAIGGRALVRVAGESMKIGDRLTSSAESGVAMKATRAGNVFGRALQPYAGGSEEMILAEIDVGYFSGEVDVPAGAAAIEDLVNNDGGVSVDSSGEIGDSGLTVETIGSEGNMFAILSDAIFFGRPYFNSDTGGFAVIRNGEKSARVVYEREYLETPVVSATMSLPESLSDSDREWVQQMIFGSNIKYIVTENSVYGFTIILNDNAPADITFSWIALAVKDARTFESSDVDNAVVDEIPEDVNMRPSAQEETITNEEMQSDDSEISPIDAPVQNEDVELQETESEETASQEPPETELQETPSTESSEVEPAQSEASDAIVGPVITLAMFVASLLK